jgi:hypothetical protein
VWGRSIAWVCLGLLVGCGDADEGPAFPFGDTSAASADSSATNTEITTGAIPTGGPDDSDGGDASTTLPPGTDDGPMVTTGDPTDPTTTTMGAGSTGDDTTDTTDTGPPGDCDPILVEVLYDLPGSDAQLEWVRLYNPCAAAIDLSGYSLGYGGTDYTYGTLDLSGSIGAADCAVIGGPTSSAANGSPSLDLAVDFNPDVQNSGPTADAVALFAGPAASIAGATPIDAVIYGAANDNALIDATGVAAVPHVGDAPEGSVIVRTSLGATWAIDLPAPGLCPPF